MRLNLANQITIVRLLLIIPFFLCMMQVNDIGVAVGMRRVSLGIFLVMAVSDALDGYLARCRNQSSRLGSFLDPLADKLLITVACILLSIEKTAIAGYRLPMYVVAMIISKDIILLLGFIVIYLVTGRMFIEPHKIGKWATFFQCFMVAAMLMGPDVEVVLPLWRQGIGILYILTAVLAVLSMLIYIRAGIRYIEAFSDNGRIENEEGQK